MYVKADLSGLQKIAKGDRSFIDRLLEAFDDELVFFEKELSVVRETGDPSVLRPAFHKIRPTLDLLSLGLMIRQIELLVIGPVASLDESVALVSSAVRHLRDDIAEARGM